LILRPVRYLANLSRGTDDLTSDPAGLRTSGDLLRLTYRLAALVAAGKADSGADRASSLGARCDGNTFDERVQHATPA
jgi:hypothetical protein